MRKTTQSDMAQPKIRWTNKEIIQLMGIEAYLKASKERRRMEKGHPNIEWILVPSMNLKMISVIGADEFDKKQEGVGCIIHDNLYKLQA